MKIYDCFIFFNELELLKLRLQELYDSVDYFVIVEANKTFSGKDKEFIFEKNEKNFEKWLNKIIYIQIKNMPKISKIGEKIQRKSYQLHDCLKRKNLNKFFRPKGAMIHLGIGRWKTQIFQRNAIIRGLENAKDNDIILISDIDEIPNKNKFKKMKKMLQSEDKIGFVQKEYNYCLNCFAKFRWIGTKACKFKTLKKIYKNQPQRIRRDKKESYTFKKIFKNKEIKLIENGGWHFSYIGKPEKIKEKFSAMSGSINLKTNLKEIKENLEKNQIIHDKKRKIKIVQIDKSFPQALRKNIKEYKHLIKDVKTNKK